LGQHPGREAFDVTFQHLLHDLIGLVGRHVVVCASTEDGYPTLASMGVLSGAFDVVGDPDGEHEVLYFPIDGEVSTGFLLTRKLYTGAEWAGDVLRIQLGQVVVEIDPQ
jgi:hypothetical protein